MMIDGAGDNVEKRVRCKKTKALVIWVGPLAEYICWELDARYALLGAREW